MDEFKKGSWEEACLGTVRYVGRQHYPLRSLEELWLATDKFQDQSAVARLGHAAWVKASRPSRNDFVRFLAAKQHDYGPKNILMFGHDGLNIRTWDKIARIENLKSRQSEGTVEPLTDAYNDILGYCVLSIMLSDRTFELPLECDMTEPEEQAISVAQPVHVGDVIRPQLRNLTIGRPS